MPLIEIKFSKKKKTRNVKNTQEIEEKPHRNKRKPQFSKVWLCISLGISIFYTSLTYFFAWCGKETVSDVTIAINELLWGHNAVAFSGYALTNCVRAFTASKYGINTEKKDNSDEEAKG